MRHAGPPHPSPFTRRAGRRARVRALAGVLLSLALVVPLTGTPAGALTLKPSPKNAAKDFVSLSAVGCFAGYDKTTNKECFYGKDDGPTVALIGDSHGSAVFPGVNAAVQARG